MLDENQVIEIFKALADPNRLQVFQLLLDSEEQQILDQLGCRREIHHFLHIHNITKKYPWSTESA